jgi:hypothetical protein
LPADDEVVAALAPLTAGASDPNLRRRTFEDLLWTVFNSKEFLFHH